jgi:LysM repeat protein
MFGWQLFIEHLIDYIRTQERGHDPPGAEGSDMTRIGTFPEPLVEGPARVAQAPTASPRSRPRKGTRRPAPQRPAVAGARYRGTGVRVSRAPHRIGTARPVTPVTVVVLALLAGIITVWLGAVAQFGEAVRGATAPVPDRLAVVQVQSGESLQHVAARVAPDAPVGTVVDRIRELNGLDSAGVDAGQTLIAPVG